MRRPRNPIPCARNTAFRSKDDQGARASNGNQVPRDRCGAQQAGSEALDNSCHGIQRIRVSKGVRNEAGGVHHRRCIHEKLNGKRNGVSDIAVLDGEGAKPQPKSRSRGRRHQDEHRKKNDPQCRRCSVPGHQHKKQQEGDEQIDKSSEHRSERNDEPWEVNFAQHVHFFDQASARIIQRVRKVGPWD